MKTKIEELIDKIKEESTRYYYIEDILVARYYTNNMEPENFEVRSFGNNTFECCNTLEEAKQALVKYRKRFADSDFYILEML